MDETDFEGWNGNGDILPAGLDPGETGDDDDGETEERR